MLFITLKKSITENPPSELEGKKGRMWIILLNIFLIYFFKIYLILKKNSCFFQ